MILLDTDHVTVLKGPVTKRRARLLDQIDRSSGAVGTTIVTVEEQMRGWLAVLAREKSLRRQVGPYRELATLFRFFGALEIALFDDVAVEQFEALKLAKLRIGTMDLKIAAIALANDAVLLTANRQDFEKVPGLRFENWLD